MSKHIKLCALNVYNLLFDNYASIKLFLKLHTKKKKNTTTRFQETQTTQTRKLLEILRNVKREMQEVQYDFRDN